MYIYFGSGTPSFSSKSTPPSNFEPLTEQFKKEWNFTVSRLCELNIDSVEPAVASIAMHQTSYTY